MDIGNQPCSPPLNQMTGRRSSRSAERPSTTITRVSLPVPDDFNFWRTVQSHGWCVLPPFACDRKRRELERVVTISPGLSAHCLLRGGEKAVTCTIRSTHPLSRQEKDTVVAALRTCLRLDEDFTAFEDTVKMICTTHHDRLTQPAEPRMRSLLLLLFSAWTVQTVAQPLVLDMDVFSARRTAFGQLMEPRSVAILPSSPESRWNPEVKYRQENNFYYVSGFEEPESMLLINPSAPRYKYVLFVRERDPEAELYEGSRTRREGAMDTYGADTALYTKDFDRVIHSLIPHDCTIYYPFGVNNGMDEHVKGLFIEGRSGALWPIIDPSPLLAGMRLIKNEGDWRMGLRRAVEISVAGHTEAMKSIRPGIYEYEVQAVFEYLFRKSGSPRNGFPCIIASGPNSSILHYDRNTRRMEEGDVVIMDCGAEYGYYSGDITRTVPVSGTFTKEQREIYQIVLDAEEAAIHAVRPGIARSVLDTVINAVMAEGLIRLGLVKNRQELRFFAPHGHGHWLGLDVHDVGGYIQNRRSVTLRPGMVLTIEPGLYLQAGILKRMEAAGYTEEELAQYSPVLTPYLNIGVRIEDDIAVTEDGHRVLSQAVPRTIADIERLMEEAGLDER